MWGWKGTDWFSDDDDGAIGCCLLEVERWAAWVVGTLGFSTFLWLIVFGRTIIVMIQTFFIIRRQILCHGNNHETVFIDSNKNICQETNSIVGTPIFILPGDNFNIRSK